MDARFAATYLVAMRRNAVGPVFRSVAAISVLALSAYSSAAPASGRTAPHHGRAASAPSPAANTALSTTIERYSAKLGYRRDVSAAVTHASLPSEIAVALNGELKQLYRCDVFTRSGVNRLIKTLSPGLPLGVPPVFPFPIQQAGDTILGLPLLPLLRPPSITLDSIRPGGPVDKVVAACGKRVVTRLQAVKSALTGIPAAQRGSSLDFWPVFSYQPSGGGRTYRHDYILLVDGGSNNTFDNNAGGNMIDVWRGPAGQHAPIVAPARGCIDALDIIRAKTCTVSSAALLETGANNTFGVKTAPDPQTDGVCTNSPVESRVFVQGTGLLGVGALIEAGSGNTFTGKVLTTGTGHVDGYGYLRVDGDGNKFSVIRFGMGDAVVGGTGTLMVNGNSNSYGTYLPEAKRPSAIPGTYGSGGVVNDLNNCDAGVTLTLGAGEVGGTGIFSATGAHNTYAAPTQSLGFGTVGGRGTFSSTGADCTNTYSGPGVSDGRGPCTTVQTSNGSFTDR